MRHSNTSLPAKFGGYRTNRFKVIHFFVNFSFSSVAILDFEKLGFCAFHSVDGVKAKLHAKFGENQSNGSEVIEVFVNFKIAAPPSWIQLFSNF